MRGSPGRKLARGPRRTAWTAGNETFQPDEVVVIALGEFLAGARRFTKVFEPGPRRALQGFFWTAGRLVLSVLDDLRPLFLSLTRITGKQHQSPGCRRSAP